MLIVHVAFIMFMTIGACKLCVIAGIFMTIGATFPLAAVFARIDRERAGIMITIFSRLPTGVKRMAILAFRRKIKRTVIGVYG